MRPVGPSHVCRSLECAWPQKTWPGFPAFPEQPLLLTKCQQMYFVWLGNPFKTMCYGTTLYSANKIISVDARTKSTIFLYSKKKPFWFVLDHLPLSLVEIAVMPLYLTKKIGYGKRTVAMPPLLQKSCLGTIDWIALSFPKCPCLQHVSHNRFFRRTILMHNLAIRMLT